MFAFSTYFAKSKYYGYSNILVVGKMNNGIGGVAIEKVVGLKPKIYSSLVIDSSEPKNPKGVNKNLVDKISHNEYKDVLLNKKYLRHSMNRTESKNYRIGTYEINKISLSCFDSSIYVLDNEIDALALGAQS